ncbi:MAG: NAD(P)-dependent oxidoreductase [Isosphaeraceae bacterium]
MRVVLTGASGQLGSYVAGRLIAAGHEVWAWSGGATGERAGVPLRPVDLTDAGAVERALREADPAVVIHAAALSTAEGVRRDPERAWKVNVEATARLADWCARKGRKLIHTSTDLVFNGLGSFRQEDDPAEPILAYGRSKREAEPAVLSSPGGLVARMSLMFGPSRAGRPTYLDQTAEALRRGEPQTFFEDEYRTPLDFDTAAEALTRLAASEAAGLLHIAGSERMSRFELVRRFATTMGLDPRLVGANRQRDVTFPEPRPADVSLDTTRLAALLPDLERPSVESAIRSLWGLD